MKVPTPFLPRRLAHRHAKALAALTGGLIAGCLALGALGGCAHSGGIEPRAQLLAATQAGLPASTPAPAAVASDWWRAFGDAALDALVQRALAEQPSLKVAAARLARAEAALASAQADDSPRLAATFDATREHFSAHSIYPPPLGGSIRTIATLQFGASWELDFFGRHRAALETATGQALAAQADAAAARVVLASSVVRLWAQLGRLQEQRDLAWRVLGQREAMLGLVRQRVHAGLDTAVELRQAEGPVADARQQLEWLDEQSAIARHALAALTAQAPDALNALAAPRLTAAPRPLPTSLPADLLGRRADISAARWRVEAASGDARAARALFYPNVNLVAFAGVSSLGLDRLLRSGSEQYGAGPALSLPVFDAGRLRANLRAKTADLDAAVESYNLAVLDAVREVADQLGTLAAIGQQQREQAAAGLAAEGAHTLAQQRFRAGLANRLTVLQAESAVLAQQRSAVELRWRQLDTQIALVKALGGGYAPAAPL